MMWLNSLYVDLEAVHRHSVGVTVMINTLVFELFFSSALNTQS